MRGIANPLIFWGELCPVLGRMFKQGLSVLNTRYMHNKKHSNVVVAGHFSTALFSTLEQTLVACDSQRATVAF